MFRVVTLTLLIILVFTNVTFSYSSQLSLAQNTTSPSSQPAASFVNSFEKLVNGAHNLTQSYQNEVGKWKIHQYGNTTMISITNNYLPKYENLVNQSKTLQPPKQYQNATDYIQRVLNRSFKVICISGIIYLQITLLRMNCLKGFCQTHSITRLIRLRR